MHLHCWAAIWSGRVDHIVPLGFPRTARSQEQSLGLSVYMRNRNLGILWHSFFDLEKFLLIFELCFRLTCQEGVLRARRANLIHTVHKMVVMDLLVERIRELGL